MQMLHDVERFSRWAPTYDRHYLQRIVFEPVQKTVLEFAASEMQEPARILDVGCGTGRLLKATAEQFPNATLEGVDAAEGMVEQARSTNSSDRIKFQQATAERLPFPGAQFDLVFSTMTFHHWA
ncbi:MAG TPA: class I SAM-dependent methyltransferase, partial [Candidatus Dormibacteraeota bacterium]|nr:class I SAM-dependent methyltransferase [Candidatus Dormibacteraeota bacterium]